jgi:hypothetical protein
VQQEGRSLGVGRMIPRTDRKAAIPETARRTPANGFASTDYLHRAKALDKFKTQIREMPIGPVRCPVDELVSVRRQASSYRSKFCALWLLPTPKIVKISCIFPATGTSA